VGRGHRGAGDGRLRRVARVPRRGDVHTRCEQIQPRTPVGGRRPSVPDAGVCRPSAAEPSALELPSVAGKAEMAGAADRPPRGGTIVRRVGGRPAPLPSGGTPPPGCTESCTSRVNK
jgi:hypothetical protein